MNANRPAESFVVLPGMKPTYTTDPHRPGDKRLPGCAWLPNRARHLLIAILGEFIGTYLFLFFAFAGTQVANTSDNDEVDSPASTSTLLYISLAFGFSLAVNVWIFFRISGGLFNPAVTVALALVGAIDWVKAALLTFAQVLAGIAAAGVVSALFPGPFAVRTTLSNDTSITRGLFIEMLLTAELIFTIFMLAAEKHKATFLAPIGIGLALFIAELAGVFYTGGSLNPARSFGPDVVLHTFDGYHWIYWVGPLLGAIVAVVFYRLIKLLEYETANPDADSDGHEAQHGPTDTPTPAPAPAPAAENDAAHANHPTDGTDESQFSSSIHPINKTFSQQRTLGSARDNTTSAETGSYSQSSHYQHGFDGHYSRSHSAERARPKHRHSRSSTSSRSHYELSSAEHSFRSGPSIESGEEPGSSKFRSLNI